MTEEDSKASGVRVGKAEYKEAMSDWIEAIDSIAAIRLANQAGLDLDRALAAEQEHMQTGQLMVRMNDKARREVQASYKLIVQAHEDAQLEVLDTVESQIFAESVLDPLEEEGIRNFQDESFVKKGKKRRISKA